MSKKKSKKDNVLIETVKMQGEQAMQLVKQAKNLTKTYWMK